MNKKYSVLVLAVLFIFFILPANAQTGTQFTVYGQVFDTDGSPVNGIAVSLTANGGTISNTTSNATNSSGALFPGYYYLHLANLPVGVGSGTDMTVQATTTGKSATRKVTRAEIEPQKIDLTLSIAPAVTPTPTATRRPSGGGGGGGGGATSGEQFENIEKRESREEFLVKDIPSKYRFTSPDLPISQVQITSTINAGVITAQVELLKGPSILVKEKPPGTVYKNINIWLGTSGFAVPKNIKEALIKFNVEKSWIESGGFMETSIVMLRWDGEKWIALDTKSIDEDNTFIFYEAKTDAFSPFVITTKAEAVVVETTPKEEVKETPTATPIPTEEAPGFEIVMAMLSIIYVIWRIRK